MKKSLIALLNNCHFGHYYYYYYCPKIHPKADAVPFANGFVCLELIVTGPTSSVGEWLDYQANTA